MKCLPQSKVPLSKGNVLHDSHAEILAIRAFNRFLVDECAELAKQGFGSRSQWVRWRERYHITKENEAQEDSNTNAAAEGQQPFEFHDDVDIHMYCSECPCGDASMENVMAAQSDATPWSLSQSATPDLLGRGHFDQLGVVRRKPARADAPVTLSKSCSDKLALKQVTGLLSSVVSKLVWPDNVYLASIVLPEAQVVPSAIERAWSSTGRMKPLAGVDPEITQRWLYAGYSFRPFSVRMTSEAFEYSRPEATLESDDDAAVPSNISTIYTPNTSEVLINGVLQGRRQFDPKGASCISRRKIWSSVLEAAQNARDATQQIGEDKAGAQAQHLVDELTTGSHADVKNTSRVRQEVKQHVQSAALKGWTKNDGDDDWQLSDTG